MKRHIRKFLAEIGSKGGKAKSEAKAAAAKKNGAKGGRPRKKPKDEATDTQDEN